MHLSAMPKDVPLPPEILALQDSTGKMAYEFCRGVLYRNQQMTFQKTSTTQTGTYSPITLKTG